MSDQQHNDPKGQMVLKHEPVGWFRPAFYVSFTLGVLYLGYILLTTWDKSVH